MSKETVCCCIEHHAVLFALMAKHGVELCGERGRESILKGMTIYGEYLDVLERVPQEEIYPEGAFPEGPLKK